MFKNLFKNPGKKIKKIAIVLFCLLVIASVILAFVFGWTVKKDGNRVYDRDFNAAYFFGFLIGCPLVSYVSTLGLIAFGDLVENSQRIKEIAEKSQEN